MRNLLCLTSAALGFVIALSGIARATEIYTAANGATSFPGQSVGTVGFGESNTDQIGNLSLYNGGSGGAFVNTANNPSIYSFYYAGGNLLIQEEIGNNGIGDAIDVELDKLGSSTSTSPSATLASIAIPFSSGPSSTYTVYDGYLAAGSYAIDSYLALGNATDPNYQINFAVPEPSGMAVLSVGLIGLGYVSQRRRSGAPVASAA
ncbi:PEP-CTERM sorting domain-containing protein [Rhodopila sp.]|uniref:PEP-CTERM sorting domain-containing protein n=1 Tax=Rhodopila sp. TaxID=2480087 RepID=UPI003D1310F4